MSEAAHILIRADEIEPQAVREIETRLRDLILRGHRMIVVELPDWGGLDASLAGMLLRVQRSLSWRNGRLIVVAPEKARRTLDFMGLSDALAVGGLAAALAYAVGALLRGVV